MSQLTGTVKSQNWINDKIQFYLGGGGDKKTVFYSKQPPKIS